MKFGKKKRLEAPKHLSESSRVWWKSVNSEWELDDHHRHLLTLACECLDRVTQAREAVLADGLFFVDRHGARKPHPGLSVERDNRTLFTRIVRELQLDAEATPDAKRPPELSYYRRANAAQKIG